MRQNDRGKPITAKQQAFRDSIVKPKIAKINPAKKPPEPTTKPVDDAWAVFILSRLNYMHNCLYWIEDAVNEKTASNRMDSAIESLIMHCNRIKEKMKNNQP